MPRTLPILVHLACLIGLHCTEPACEANLPPAVGRSADANESPVPDTLVGKAIARLEKLPGFQAAFRLTVTPGQGRSLVGEGQYAESMRGDSRLTRLEVNFRMTNQDVFALLQVNDGDTLWTRRTLGNSVDVTRADADHNNPDHNNPDHNKPDHADAHRAGGRQPRPAAPDREKEMPRAGDIGLPSGGLTGLLNRIAADYQFDLAQAGVLRMGDRREPVWQLKGHLSRAARKRLGLAGASGEEPADNDGRAWPAMLPDEVALLLTSEDLRPRRIEFRHSGRRQPLATIDLKEISLQQPAPDRFRFDPGDEPVVVETTTSP